jgi:hypothetical protein
MTDETPDRPPEPIGPAGVPLSATPTEALAFALGYIAARPVNAGQYGGVCALVEELQSRTMLVGLAGSDAHSYDAYTALLAALPAEMARSIQLLYQSHRGRRWDRSGRTGWGR